MRRSAYGVFAAVLGGCDAAPQLAPDAGATVTAIADDYYALVLERAPETAELAAIDSEHHEGLFDNRPAAYDVHRRAEDRLQARLSAIRLDDLAGTPQVRQFPGGLLRSRSLRTPTVDHHVRVLVW